MRFFAICVACNDIAPRLPILKTLTAREVIVEVVDGEVFVADVSVRCKQNVLLPESAVVVLTDAVSELETFS